MRNPGRTALACSIALAAAAGLVGFGISRDQGSGSGWSVAGPIVLGLAVLPFALVTFVQALFAARGRARLVAGKGVIARWHVAAADWDRFRGVDSLRAGEDPDFGNELWIRGPTPGEGVEVVVGEKGVLVDGSYHGLSPRGLPELRTARWVEGPPRCLEFGLLYPPTRYGGRIRMALRVPVPAGALGAAERVLAHYESLCRRTPGLALRQPRHTLEVGAVLIVLAIPLGAAGYTAASADLIGPALIIAAAVVAVFALLALTAWLLTRPGSR